MFNEEVCKCCYKPGWMGRKVGRSQNSGGIGLVPLHSNTPSIWNLGSLHTSINSQQMVIVNVNFWNFKNIPFPTVESDIWLESSQKMVIPKAKPFPKKVCVLHHRDQGSIFVLLHKHCPDHHQVLPQAYACKCSWKLYRTWCYGLLCEVPNHRLHSKYINL